MPSLHLPSRGLTATLALLVAIAAPAVASGNGRFPLANHLIFDPATPGRAVLRTSFGLLASTDGARSWRWICEETLSDLPLRDPSVVFGSDGRVVVASSVGLVASTSLCRWDRPMGSPSVPVVDLTADATGRRVLAAVGAGDGLDGVALSDDGGATWSAASRMDGLLVTTVDVAPSMATRAYLSGNLSAVPVLSRSDDGGATFHEVSRGFDGAGVVYIAAVDRTNPDVLYLRAQHGGAGTVLLRSDDGGASTHELGRTAYPMLGFALSDDGHTVWIASSDPQSGLLRSVDGAPFQSLGAPHATLCLRFHDGALWMCAAESYEGFTLGRSTDGGDHFDPVLRLRDVGGPAACAPGTPVADECGPLWPAQRAMFPAIDAGSPDVTVPPVVDASAMDVASDRGAPARSDDPTCGCRAVGASRERGWWGAVVAGVSAALRRRRRRSPT